MDVPVNAPTGPSGGRGRGRGRGRDGSSQPSTRLAQNIQSYLGSDGSKPQFNKTTLKIFGLKNSKAASNADGGVRSLLEFLERKASREKTITLGKVCRPAFILIDTR
jgi:nuclear RNA export factor